MRLLCIALLTMALAGCFSEPTLNTTDEATIKASSQKISETLNESEREKFSKALMYFSIGGEDGLNQMMAAAFAGDTETLGANTAINLARINGIKGQNQAEQAAHQVGAKVRATMLDIAGVKPKDMALSNDIRRVKTSLKQTHRGLKKMDS